MLEATNATNGPSYPYALIKSTIINAETKVN